MSQSEYPKTMQVLDLRITIEKPDDDGEHHITHVCGADISGRNLRMGMEDDGTPIIRGETHAALAEISRALYPHQHIEYGPGVESRSTPTPTRGPNMEKGTASRYLHGVGMITYYVDPVGTEEHVGNVYLISEISGRNVGDKGYMAGWTKDGGIWMNNTLRDLEEDNA